MNLTSSSSTVIVAALDRSSSSNQVIESTIATARGNANVHVHLIHAVDPGRAPHLLAVPVADLIADGRTFVDPIALAAGKLLGGKVTGHVIAGEPAATILQLASDLAADLVVVGSHGKSGVQRLFLGSVSQTVMNKARCAVLVARSKDYEAVPEVEPPCSACLEVQRASNGETAWCERHSSRHPHAYLHHESPPTFGVGAMFIRPGS